MEDAEHDNNTRSYNEELIHAELEKNTRAMQERREHNLITKHDNPQRRTTEHKQRKDRKEMGELNEDGRTQIIQNRKTRDRNKQEGIRNKTEERDDT